MQPEALVATVGATLTITLLKACPESAMPVSLARASARTDDGADHPRRRRARSSMRSTASGAYVGSQAASSSNSSSRANPLNTIFLIAAGNSVDDAAARVADRHVEQPQRCSTV
jgi:hypothetical protein